MEKAILKTLIYADIFDYPLKINEIHKWLIGKKANLRQVEKGLGKLVDRLQVTGYRELYFLIRRDGIIGKRLQREKQSKVYFKKAKIIAWIFKIIPWIKLVGISGGLAMDNAGRKDDIDLFLITSKNRMWISRFLALGLLSVIGQRRKRNDLLSKTAGKLCINTLLEEDRLEQVGKDIYLAHEVLQMRVLWQRDGIYQKYLENNNWAFKYLPNWTTLTQNSRLAAKRAKLKTQNYNSKFKTLDFLENLAEKFQLWYMKQPKGLERIEDGAVYFHPKDYGYEVLTKYTNLCKIHLSFKLPL